MGSQGAAPPNPQQPGQPPTPPQQTPQPSPTSPATPPGNPLPLGNPPASIPTNPQQPPVAPVVPATPPPASPATPAPQPAAPVVPPSSPKVAVGLADTSGVSHPVAVADTTPVAPVNPDASRVQRIRDELVRRYVVVRQLVGAFFSHEGVCTKCGWHTMQNDDAAARSLTELHVQQHWRDVALFVDAEPIVAEQVTPPLPTPEPAKP